MSGDRPDPATIDASLTDTTQPRARRATGAPAGYEGGALLGRGGMGEVMVATDARIGREVAIKRVRADTSGSDSGDTKDLVARFLREAKVQARLEHPAIVPVYELGEDEHGPFFTMKRVTGKTLREVLRDGMPLQRLLRVFVDVCRAIAFAHSRGVVHRDLKPANIMLGEFGEVYVLDWGVARVLADERDLTSTGSGDGETLVGAIMGTPGYAAPEQVAGEQVGRPADVYALGAILFEVLTHEALHPRGSQPAIDSTLATPSASPAERGHLVPPELDALCKRALDRDPPARPTATALADDIERYLDGDRDVVRRKQLAAEELARAKDAVAREQQLAKETRSTKGPASRAEDGSQEAAAARATAMKAASRALALDPDSVEAAELVSSLMIRPPSETPRELRDRIREVETALAVREARNAALGMCSYFVFIPFVLWVGVRDWPVVVAVFGYVGLMIAFQLWMARGRKMLPILWVLANGALAVLLSRLFSPWLVCPAIIVSTAIVTVQAPLFMDRMWLVMGSAVGALLLPFALESTGVFASTWSIDDGVVTIRSAALAFDGVPGAIYLATCYLVLILGSTWFGRTIAATRRHAQQRLESQAWHLRQLVPVEPPHALASRPRASPR
jgi:eukaryotic-like serine/threonine-protein kinase